MAKSYSKKTTRFDMKVPKKETVDFLLKYSKALHVMSVNNLQIKILLN